MSAGHASGPGRQASPAHAKVNLGLAVVGRREDGYHELRSVFLRLGLHDRLVAQARRTRAGDGLVIEGEGDARPDDLVLRATAALRARLDPDARRETDVPLPALSFRLHKRIPIAAGLGGGSSDAAAAMRLALAAWGRQLHLDERLGLALALGADVPFFASGHDAALVGGIGEALEALPAPDPPIGLVLVTPPERLSTAGVFAAHDRLARTGLAGTWVESVAGILRQRADGASIASAFVRHVEDNDLWPAALELSPALATVREAMSETLGRAAHLSGSGPTLFAVYPSAAAAGRAARRLRDSGQASFRDANIIATSSMRRAAGP